MRVLFEDDQSVPWQFQKVISDCEITIAVSHLLRFIMSSKTEESFRGTLKLRPTMRPNPCEPYLREAEKYLGGGGIQMIGALSWVFS
jgi:hypothetical protein